MTQSADAMCAQLGIVPLPLPPRYNIAPTQDAPVLLDNGRRQMQMLRWGLIPGWSKDESIGNRMINARAETLLEKPSFRKAFQSRRCLVLADGYYEWKKSGATKIPFRFTLRSGEPFAFAGLWERWQRPDGLPLFSFAIITTEANEEARPIHDRMPVILAPVQFEQWLDPKLTHANVLQKWLNPAVNPALVCYPVSEWVNNPRNDDRRCIEGGVMSET